MGLVAFRRGHGEGGARVNSPAQKDHSRLHELHVENGTSGISGKFKLATSQPFARSVRRLRISNFGVSHLFWRLRRRAPILGVNSERDSAARGKLRGHARLTRRAGLDEVVQD